MNSPDKKKQAQQRSSNAKTTRKARSGSKKHLSALSGHGEALEEAQQQQPLEELPLEPEPVPDWVENPPQEQQQEQQQEQALQEQALQEQALQEPVVPEQEQALQEPEQQQQEPTPPAKAGFMSRFSGIFSRKKEDEAKSAPQTPAAPQQQPQEQQQTPPTAFEIPSTAQVKDSTVIPAPAPAEPEPSHENTKEEGVREGTQRGDNEEVEEAEKVAPPEPPSGAETGQSVEERQRQEEAPPQAEERVEVQVPDQEERLSVVLSQQHHKAEERHAKASAPSVPLVMPAKYPEEVKPAQINTAPGGMPFMVRYQIYPENPEVYVGIIRDPESGGYRYIVVEPRLTSVEQEVYAKLTRLLVDELEVDMAKLRNSKLAQSYLFDEVQKLAKKYDLKISRDSYRKLSYYFTRDYIKLGKIEVLMNDPHIEDISCDGPQIPLFIWHRDYESIPTNLIFKNDEELNTFAAKLAYVSGKHISIAQPIVDASLPDGSRIQITYGKEITRKGSTFTIRKFKGDPITIVDMLKYNTCSPELGAYLWYLIERRMSLLVAGGTASGKTTTLNALSMFIPPDQKIVSVEDTPELNLSHKNWIQSVSRGGGIAGEITLFDLLKAAMRQRPDIIIVGEVRGVEAFTLFQAIATGHGGLGTIHADSVEAAINRITSEPMNVPKSLLGSTLDCLVMQLRIKLKDKSVRRMVHVAEIVGHEASTDQIVLNNAFKWDPVSDQYVFSGRSRLFEKITKRYGTTPEKIRQDLEDRRVFLQWLMSKNIRDYRDLSQQIREFYSNREEAIERAMRAMESGKP